MVTYKDNVPAGLAVKILLVEVILRYFQMPRDLNMHLQRAGRGRLEGGWTT